MQETHGVFLARMQPVHNAHLYLVNKALDENGKVLVVLGSENKIDTHRNPYGIALRKKMFRECLTDDQNARLSIMTLPDWSTEDAAQDDQIWGMYFYFNVVARICAKKFSLYFSDDEKLLYRWFSGTPAMGNVTFRHFERQSVFDGLSATRIRQALIDGDRECIARFCPEPVQRRFDELAEYYRRVEADPKPDLPMA